MGQRMHINFQKRFGGRITVVYAEKPLTPAVQKIQNETLTRAITQVLAGILKRDPTQDELLGLVDIASVRRRRLTQMTEHSVILQGG